jgi:hypothetical protein
MTTPDNPPAASVCPYCKKEHDSRLACPEYAARQIPIPTCAPNQPIVHIPPPAPTETAAPEMTPTPLTDGVDGDASGKWVKADFARQLERALTAAQAKVAELEASLVICRSNIADMDERLTLMEPVRDKIRAEHKATAEYNAGVINRPQGPCQCAVCKPDLNDRVESEELTTLRAENAELRRDRERLDQWRQLAKRLADALDAIMDSANAAENALKECHALVLAEKLNERAARHEGREQT